MLNKIKKMIDDSKVGSISYSEYIELTLYDDEHGYYMKEQPKIGKAGDFYTSSNVHSVFGKALSRIFIQLVQKGILPPFICEIGGGTGRLADFILTEWKRIDPNSFEHLQYFIIETSPYHQKQQQLVIHHLDKVRQFETLDDMISELGKFTGIVLSNELFDAFPVDVVEKKEDTLFEVRVTLDRNGNLSELLVPCSKSELMDWLTEHDVALKNGQRIEIPITMMKWFEQTENWFEKGIMFTIDYGYTNDEWMDPIHHDGSLRGYYKHNMILNPLQNPGEMDLTTHIHLDALIQKGEQVGLKLVEMMNQHHFLLRGGILEYLQENYDPNPFSEISKQNRAIRTLISGSGISSSFTVIIQQKNILNLSSKDILVHEIL